MPDILVKGADYTVENIAGAKEVLANGGEVKTITLVEGYSSTSIINKIRMVSG
jgi:bifunctional ADP-heptose synthase (sugar kinase/adenylyltransferase)